MVEFSLAVTAYYGLDICFSGLCLPLKKKELKQFGEKKTNFCGEVLQYRKEINFGGLHSRVTRCSHIFKTATLLLICISLLSHAVPHLPTVHKLVWLTDVEDVADQVCPIICPYTTGTNVLVYGQWDPLL